MSQLSEALNVLEEYFRNKVNVLAEAAPEIGHDYIPVYMHGSNWNRGQEGQSFDDLTDKLFNHLIEWEIRSKEGKQLDFCKVLVKTPEFWYFNFFTQQHFARMVSQNHCQRSATEWRNMLFEYDIDGNLVQVLISFGESGERKMIEYRTENAWLLEDKKAIAVDFDLAFLPDSISGATSLSEVQIRWTVNIELEADKIVKGL